MQFMIAGAMINSWLYLAAVFIAGFMDGKDVAWKLDIAAIGVTYLSYLAAIPRLQPDNTVTFDPTPRIVTPRWQIAAQPILVWLSIAMGAGAGIALLF